MLLNFKSFSLGIQFWIWFTNFTGSTIFQTNQQQLAYEIYQSRALSHHLEKKDDNMWYCSTNIVHAVTNIENFPHKYWFD